MLRLAFGGPKPQATGLCIAPLTRVLRFETVEQNDFLSASSLGVSDQENSVDY